MIIDRLRSEYPESTISLNFSTKLELLVAVILSAQCPDERVNSVTADLFEKYQTPADYLAVSQDELAEEINSITYYNSKAGYIQDSCRKIHTEYDDTVPETMDALTELPGVGRKTANVVLQHGHDTVEGIVVDTHVQRLARRLGLTEYTTPAAIERDLMEIVPEDDWQSLTHLFIDHGRAVCTARSPDCESCVLAADCPSSRRDAAIDLASGEPWET